MKNIIIKVHIIGLIAISIGIPAKSFSDDSLRGIKKYYIMVEDPGEGGRATGFTRELIQTTAELKLRMAGIEIAKEPPYSLYIQPICVLLKDQSAAVCSIRVAALLPVIMLHDNSILTGGETWNKSWVGMAPLRYSKSHFKSALEEQLDMFLVAYLKANPK